MSEVLGPFWYHNDSCSSEDDEEIYWTEGSVGSAVSSNIFDAKKSPPRGDHAEENREKATPEKKDEVFADFEGEGRPKTEAEQQPEMEGEPETEVEAEPETEIEADVESEIEVEPQTELEDELEEEPEYEELDIAEQEDEDFEINDFDIEEIQNDERNADSIPRNG